MDEGRKRVDCGQHPSCPEARAVRWWEAVPPTVATIADAVRWGRRNHARNRPALAHVGQTGFNTHEPTLETWAQRPV